MEDSDDDIMILEEVNPHNMKSKKWKYKAPNPTLGSEDAQEVLKNVREKLNMQNPVMFGVKDKRNVINSRRNKLRLIKEPTKSKVQILEPCMVQEKTPKKSVPEQAPLLLSPKDILELTENCLDSDNEPCSNSVETPQSQQHGLPISSGPRKALSFSAKTSCSVRFNASKFFGAGTSSAEVNEILSQENMSHLSPTKSPSSKKKRLSKHSPIRLLPSHRNLGKSPGKRSPGKRSPGKLGTEFHCPTKCNSGFWNQEISTLGISKLPNETETQTYDGETIAEGPYYYEAFCFMIKKIYENLEHRHLFLETEIRKMSEVSTAKSEFQLYVRLMNRKDRWNRCSDISYEDIAKDLSPLFDFLEAHELISCNVSDMKLEGLLQLLKKDELKMVCDEFKVKKNGNKPNLVDALLSMHRSQPTLNGISPLSKRVKALLGRCVKLNMIWRLVFRRCILLFSMFHSYEDLDALCSEQALLLLQVKLKNVVYPLQEIKNYQGSRIFSHRDQLIRFEEASELRQDLNNAIKIKDFKIVSNLTERGMKQFSTLLELTSETDHVLQLPSFLQRYSAGSMYARTLSTACDALKQGQMHKLALDVLELLLSQSIYCLRLKGEWLLKQATIYHVNIKDVVSVSYFKQLRRSVRLLCDT